MRKIKQVRHSIWIMVCLLMLGCNETIPVGSEILPGTDGSGNFYTDTTTLITTTITEDSLRSDKLLISQLGFTSDPIFGTTKSSLLMGFRAPGVTVNPAVLDDVGGYQLDSIVLALKINGIYGDTLSPMNFKVYKLLNPLDPDIAHFSNESFPQSMLEVGSISGYTPDLTEYDEDTTFVNLGAQLRIKLNPFFGQSIINVLGTEIMSSDELFHQFLPGLVVVPDNQGGSIIELDMLANAAETSRENALEDSRIHIYFRNGDEDTLNIMIPVTMLDLGISQYIHDFSGSNVGTAIGSMDPNGDSVCFIQGLAGVKTKITLPYLSAYGEIAIQKAELVITRILDGFEETYLPPDRIFALKIDSNNTNGNTSDFEIFSDAHIGGFSNEVTLNNGSDAIQYRINISNHLQNIILGDEVNDGFYLTLYGAQELDIIALNPSDLIPDRIVIGGANNSSEDYKLKLEVTYTILN